MHVQDLLPVVASLPSQTIVGTTAADIRASTPGTNALVETYQGADTITLNNGGDYSLAADGADSILVGGTATVNNNQSVVAGLGNDTITFNSAAGLLASSSGSFEANQGNDSIFFGSAGGQGYLLNQAFIGGGLDLDTISISSAVTQAISASIKGGDHADSILLTSGFGVLTNTELAGNKGGDTIDVTTTSAISSSINGGLGHDSITIGTGSVAGLVRGGAGNDTISLQTGANALTISGGGLADTINLTTGAMNVVTVYGDGQGVTSAGTGTGGAADGADQIGSSSVSLGTGASIYGAGGADTIEILGAAAVTGNTVLLNGGDGADTIFMQSSLNTGAVSILGGNGADTIAMTTSVGSVRLDGGNGQDSIFLGGASSSLTVAGGAGLDSITINAVAASANNIDGGSQADQIYISGSVSAGTALALFGGNGSITGGDGADTIAALGFGSAGSITGGAGNDSIVLGTAAILSWTANGTINGGAGTDTITLQASAAAASAVTSQTISTGVASIAYESGDVIQLAFTAGGTQAVGGTVNVGTSAGTVTGISAAANGGLYAYSDGTDTYFGFNSASGTAGEIVAFRVTGADLILTTSINQNLAANTTNVSFSLGGTTTTGLTITLI